MFSSFHGRITSFLRNFFHSVLFINVYLIVYLKLVNINALSFEPNNTGKLNVNQLKLTFNVGRYDCVGSSLNYEISNGIYKMFFLFIYLLYNKYNSSFKFTNVNLYDHFCFFLLIIFIYF
jgi:hypothetical protein